MAKPEHDRLFPVFKLGPHPAAILRTTRFTRKNYDHWKCL